LAVAIVLPGVIFEPRFMSLAFAATVGVFVVGVLAFSHRSVRLPPVHVCCFAVEYFRIARTLPQLHDFFMVLVQTKAKAGEICFSFVIIADIACLWFVCLFVCFFV
jgi:hypothetical protein